jgi:hypothetical protein
MQGQVTTADGDFVGDIEFFIIRFLVLVIDVGNIRIVCHV